MKETDQPTLWQLFVLTASIMTVIILALTITLPILRDVEQLLVWADTAVCSIFLADFLVIFFRSKKKMNTSLNGVGSTSCQRFLLSKHFDGADSQGSFGSCASLRALSLRLNSFGRSLETGNKQQVSRLCY